MKVELLHHTPLYICSTAIRTCWDSGDKSDTCYHNEILYDSKGIAECQECGYTYNSYKEIPLECGTKDKELIDRVGNKFKHSSTLEHLNYTFYISGVSRALLQEIARHRMSSPSVKSTRYTLKELKDEEPFTYFIKDGISTTEDAIERARKYLVEVDGGIDISSLYALDRIRLKLNKSEANDKVKYLLPESYKTELTWTINARSLQNFISLRSSKSALWEIRELSKEIFKQLPEEHKYLFKDCVYTDES